MHTLQINKRLRVKSRLDLSGRHFITPTIVQSATLFDWVRKNKAETFASGNLGRLEEKNLAIGAFPSEREKRYQIGLISLSRDKLDYLQSGNNGRR